MTRSLYIAGATLAALVFAATPVHAGKVCKHVDANGAVTFEDCNAPTKAVGPREQIDVELENTGASMATESDRANWRGRKGVPAKAVAPSPQPPAADARYTETHRGETLAPITVRIKPGIH